MTYLPHHRITFKGEFKTGSLAEPYETWNTSLAFRGGDGILAADKQEIVNDAAADWATFASTTGGPSWSAQTYLTEVRLDTIGPNGRITEDAVLADANLPYGGSGSGTVLPPQCAVVLTLDTGMRGRSRFGRMYLPLLSVPVGEDGRMTEGAQTLILAGARQLIENLSNAPGIDSAWEACVASNVGSGSLHRVSSVRIGRVIDTMRSRRRSMAEDYKSASVST